MKLRSLQLVILVGLLAALLVVASGVAAQDGVGSLALTATALAGGLNAGSGPAMITPLPSLTPGGPAVLTSTPGTGSASATPASGQVATARASLTPLPSLTPAGQQAATQVPPTTVPVAAAGGTATITPLPSLTPGGPARATSTPAGPASATPVVILRATLTALPSLTPGGQSPVVQPSSTSEPAAAVAGTATITPLPSLTPGLGATLTPLPSLTPPGQPAPEQSPTSEPTAVPSQAPTLTPLPSLTPAAGGAAGGEGAGTPPPGATAVASNLAPVSIEVPYVTTEQAPPQPPASAAGMGTLILLIGLGGATIIGLLMLARDRYRDHREE